MPKVKIVDLKDHCVVFVCDNVKRQICRGADLHWRCTFCSSWGGGVLILRSYSYKPAIRSLCSTVALPTTHCCYLWWPTFGPSDWTDQPITGQSDSSIGVEGRTPPIRGHRGGLADRQAKGWCFRVSSPFCPSPLERHRHGVKLDTNTTMQDFSDRNSYLYPIIFVVFLIELEGICCAGSKSRVTLMSFQFCN